MAEVEQPKSDIFFVKAKVRDYLKRRGFNVAGEVIDGEPLNNVILNILDKATKRAASNNRKTIMPRDL